MTRLTTAVLASIRERDAQTGDLWFKGPASFTAQAARDRRALLEHLDAITPPTEVGWDANGSPTTDLP